MNSKKKYNQYDYDEIEKKDSFYGYISKLKNLNHIKIIKISN